MKSIQYLSNKEEIKEACTYMALAGYCTLLIASLIGITQFALYMGWLF